ncbi:ABC transporter permease [Emticicia sp. BO119]|uniref:ABC transporter permease n=1 Tax=Emticicia sp. BO119 TaxID=2757768 RepID=UPI0015F0D8A7|nr:ABC transporter permease [Emticicia sp. BO119]MBA4850886.1 ABC transporter permease [Emticicia sp. BO119]
MLKNYVKIAFRNLLKNKVFSIINIVGLAIGMAVCMLILLYVSHELSYDKFHRNGKNIFQTLVKMKFGANEVQFNLVSKNFGNAVKQTNPEVLDYVRIGTPFGDDVVIKSDENHKFFERKFVFSEPSLFNLFSINLLQGNPKTVLAEPNTVVINEEMAQKYFGKTDPVGKAITYNKKDVLTITGIFRKLPTNSTLDFDFIGSFLTYDAIMKRERVQMYESDEMVGTGSYETYFLLNKPESVAKVEKVIPKVLTKDENNGLISHSTFVLTPFLDSHLGNNWGDFSNTKYVSIFLIIAGIVLLLALINYMSLTTARSTVRVKEVGVRKVLGANRQHLATQFYGESIIVSLISFVLALILFQLLKQPFYNLLSLNIDDSFITSPLFLSILLALLVFTSLVAGSYPALLLSKFSPIQVLKGKFASGNQGTNLRRVFIVFQFMASVVMIICSMVVQKQLRYLQTRKIGLNKEQVLVLPLPNEARKHPIALRHDLKQEAGIQQIGASSLSMFSGGWNMYFTKTPTTNEDVSINNMEVDEDFLKILQLDWKVKPASIEQLAFGDDKIVINETAVEKLKIVEKPIGQHLNLAGHNREIVGVVKDFNFTSLQQKIDGMLLMVVKDTTQLRTLYLKIDPKVDLQKRLASIEKVYKKYEVDVPFDYYFLDDAFNKQYRSEQRMGSLFAGFTTVAILIACMGLFGLITFTAEQKIKEIGIRKVLGATIGNIVGLLSRDFIRLVLIANGIAFPIAYYFMNDWLQGFAYKTDIGAGIFVTAGILAISIALLTVLYQAIRAALMNPVKSLKSE